MRYLTIALTKGRLAKKTLELLEKTGITCEEMKDPASRKLIFTDEEHKLKFFLAKGPDVPTYVEYGAADIGIVGEDTILEEQRKIYEVLDLGFGKCRMCVCGPKENEELLKKYRKVDKQGVEQFNRIGYNQELVAAAVVEPDLNNAELQKANGVLGAAKTLAAMLYVGEYASLMEAVQELSGLDKDINDEVEEVKN